jgi:hypothetical protein
MKISNKLYYLNLISAIFCIFFFIKLSKNNNNKDLLLLALAITNLIVFIKYELKSHKKIDS